MAEGPARCSTRSRDEASAGGPVHRLRGDASERAFRLGCAPDTGKPAPRIPVWEATKRQRRRARPVAVAGVRLRSFGGGPCPVPLHKLAGERFASRLKRAQPAPGRLSPGGAHASCRALETGRAEDGRGFRRKRGRARTARAEMLAALVGATLSLRRGKRAKRPGISSCF